MNSLFLGLVAAGIALVIGVIVYNWLQERRARRRVDAAFETPGRERAEPGLRGGDDPDVVPQSVAIEQSPEELIDTTAEGDVPEVPLPRPLSPASLPRDAVAPDADIESVVMLRPAAPVASSALAQASSLRHAKPLRWLGRRAANRPWQPIDAAPGPWQEIAACLLLANRSGSASRGDIDAFLQGTAGIAATISADFSPPDAADEAARAEELDRFCADLDVQIGLTILKSELGQIAGTRLRGVAEATGFRLSPNGQFEYPDESGTVLCTLQNYRQDPFSAESLRAMSTPGVVVLIDVPRVPDPVKVFDQVRLIAKRLAKTLEGVLVDDNRRPLDDASLAAIRDQVQATAAALRAAHIEPGGTRAQRLFS
jgi:ZipA-like protein with FtsZ-binding domain